MRASTTARYLNRWIYIAEATKQKKKGKKERKEVNERITKYMGWDTQLYVKREKEEFAAPRRKRDDADLRFAFTQIYRNVIEGLSYSRLAPKAHALHGESWERGKTLDLVLPPNSIAEVSLNFLL